MLVVDPLVQVRRKVISETANDFACAAAAMPEKAEQASIFVGKYEFYGPFTDLTEVAGDPGILAVLIENDRGFELVELYECSNLIVASQAELAKSLNGDGEISVAVHYTENMTAQEVQALKLEILSEFEDSEGST